MLLKGVQETPAADSYCLLKSPNNPDIAFIRKNDELYSTFVYFCVVFVLFFFFLGGGGGGRGPSATTS